MNKNCTQSTFETNGSISIMMTSKRMLNTFSKYPFVGLAHPMGKNILESLDRFPVSAIDEGIWYLARPLKDGADPPLATPIPQPQLSAKDVTTITGRRFYT
jgi:hypothetical protein